MTLRQLTLLYIGTISLFYGASLSAREVRDTLFSESGDRIILNYNVSTTGGQMTVKFINAQKKLGDRNQKKYKKLDEVAVVFFDRTGNFRDMKFDGIETNAFMVPANVNYTRSNDGYFLLNDSPTLQFKVVQNEEAQLDIPIYLANYEGKRHYKVFVQCGSLHLSSKQGKKNGNGGGRNGGEVRAANAANIQQIGDQVITSEELVDEGLSPGDEALIRIKSLQSMLEQATEFPFDEELTHEASMLRELRFKVTDDTEVSQQITEVLALYDAKKKELAGEVKANQAAQAAQEAQAAQAAQARTDSISAAQLLQSEEEKKNMLWIGGGIAGLIALFMGGKQIFQMVNQHKLQKQQQAMMANMMKMTQTPTANIPGMGGGTNLSGLDSATNIAGLGGIANAQGLKEAQNALKDVKIAQNQVQQQARTLSKEAEAAKQKLMSMRAAKQGKGENTSTTDTPTPSPHKVMQPRPQAQRSQTQQTPFVNTSSTHPSLNDAIPAKYKRLAKCGSSPK